MATFANGSSIPGTRTLNPFVGRDRRPLVGAALEAKREALDHQRSHKTGRASVRDIKALERAFGSNGSNRIH